MNPNLKHVLREIDKERNAAIDQQKKRIAEVHKKIPRIKEIDMEISKTGVLIAKSILNNPDSYEERVREIQSKMNDLKSEKAFLLTENNIPPDYLEIQYSCDVCKDTGFIDDGSKCRCLKQKVAERSYSMSNIADNLYKENFKTFDIDLFSNEKFEDYELSPRENMINILNIAEGFCLNFDKKNNENLLFYGTTGLGKTFLCNCIAKNLLDKGKLVIYQTSFKIMEIVESHRFNRNSENFTREDYNMLFDSDLLIIDDLGTELVNSFTTTEFFNIINSRMLAGKKTLISTNLSPIDIGEIYTDRVFSRLLSNFTLIHFYGPDLRWEYSK